MAVIYEELGAAPRRGGGAAHTRLRSLGAKAASELARDVLRSKVEDMETYGTLGTPKSGRVRSVPLADQAAAALNE